MSTSQANRQPVKVRKRSAMPANSAANLIAPAVSSFLSTGWADFACSPSGTIVYQQHEGIRRLEWFDRSGRSLEWLGLTRTEIQHVVIQARRVIREHRHELGENWRQLLMEV